MSNNTHNLLELPVSDSLTLDEICRLAAQRMIRVALEAKVECYLSSMKESLIGGRVSPIVRNGYHREREIAVSSGMITVRVPRTPNKLGEPENFFSALLPRYMRRSPKIDEVIPMLYLKGVSTGDMQPVIEKLYGDGISGGSRTHVSRLKALWQKEHELWQGHDLSDKQYCYIWVDGIHFNVRLEDARLCILVAIGALPDGRKELIAVDAGYRESSESWSCLLRNLRERGMSPAKLFIGDGNLESWRAAKDGCNPRTRIGSDNPIDGL